MSTGEGPVAVLFGWEGNRGSGVRRARRLRKGEKHHALRSVRVCHYLCMHLLYMCLPLLRGLCGLTVERSLAILKVAGSNLGRSASM